MCQKCEWRSLVSGIKGVLAERHPEIGERQQVWLETIMVTVDDDRHCTDHQKAVVRRILRERGIEAWRSIPRATDKTEWSDARRRRHVERKKMSRRLRQHGGF